MLDLKRPIWYLALFAVLLFLLVQLDFLHTPSAVAGLTIEEVYQLPTRKDDGQFNWANLKSHYPVPCYQTLPELYSKRLPQVQHNFGKETLPVAKVRKQRQAKVKAALKRSWHVYRSKAWMQDELAPTCGGGKSTFGGWSATLVDTLDTLWREDVDAAVSINFSDTPLSEINVF